MIVMLPSMRWPREGECEVVAGQSAGASGWLSAAETGKKMRGILQYSQEGLYLLLILRCIQYYRCTEA